MELTLGCKSNMLVVAGLWSLGWLLLGDAADGVVVDVAFVAVVSIVAPVTLVSPFVDLTADIRSAFKLFGLPTFWICLTLCSVDFVGSVSRFSVAVVSVSAPARISIRINIKCWHLICFAENLKIR